MKTATRANQHVLADTNAAWVLADSRTGLLQAQTVSHLFGGEHKTALVEICSKEGDGGTKNSSGFSRGHEWKREVGLQSNKPLTDPLRDIGQHYVKLNDTVYLHHRSESLPPEGFETPR